MSALAPGALSELGVEVHNTPDRNRTATDPTRLPRIRFRRLAPELLSAPPFGLE